MANAVTIGIVGGGQLGRMLTQAAKPLGFEVVVLDPGANCPAAQVGARQIVGDLYDAKALARLADQSDIITVEIEHLDANSLKNLATKTGKPVHPAPQTVKLIQDKYLQKQFLKHAGLSIAPFTAVADAHEARTALQEFGGKMVLKTRHGAFDGRGNALIKKPKELDQALARFKDAAIYAEAFVPFVKELAVIVARDVRGKVATYPIVETIHVRSICDEVIAPAQIDRKVAERAIKLAKKTAKHLQGAGVFAIEMFLLADGAVMINEIAPRVHNSGHYSIEACVTSQFEQHIRAISGLPLGKTDLKVAAATMVNILGERDSQAGLRGTDKALAISGVSLHWYGKSPIKIDRKMGHITAVGDKVQTTRKQAQRARRKIAV